MQDTFSQNLSESFLGVYIYTYLQTLSRTGKGQNHYIMFIPRYLQLTKGPRFPFGYKTFMYSTPDRTPDACV